MITRDSSTRFSPDLCSGITFPISLFHNQFIGIMSKFIIKQWNNKTDEKRLNMMKL